MPRIRKLYLDVVGEDGSVCIAYVAAFDALGLGLAPCGIELYGADGSRKVMRGRASLSLAREPDAAALTGLRFSLNGAGYRFELAPEQAEPDGCGLQANGLRWRVKLARGAVALHAAGGGEPLISGCGYADYVELQKLPRALALGRLEWGRLHLQGATVVYSEVSCVARPPLRSATLWARGCAPRAIARWSLARDARDDSLRLSFGDDGTAFEAELLPQRSLHQGAATDQARFPSLLEQALYRALAGPTRERRFLSRARSPSFGDGFAVHESVRFGSAAGEAGA